MYHVYFIRSLAIPNLRYKGFTEDDPHDRLREHNGNHHGFTAGKGPWELVSYVTFKHKKTALQFEKYVKQGSGWAVAIKRFYGEDDNN
ncbi:MAG: GIY-YIG nuclease family protein [Alphaproteobacteria bacterium]